MQPDSGPLEVEETAKLGPILRDTDTSVLFEFYVEPQALGVESALILDGSLKVAMATRPTPLTPIRVRFQCDVADEPASTPPPSAILKALSKLTLYRMQERARNESQSGNYDKATRSLKNLAVHLLEQGHSDLANTVLLEAENMQRRHTFSLSGEKDIKYATRALMNLGDFSL
jgi:Ca-activated chloride channel family protein